MCFLAIVLLVGLATRTAATEPWPHCPPPLLAPMQMVPESNDNTTQIFAGEVERDATGVSRFEDNVLLLNKDREIRADRAEYDRNRDQLTLESNIIFRSPDLTVESQSAHFSLHDEQGELEQTRYHFGTSHSFGHAARIGLIDRDHTTLEQVRHTSCPPGSDEAWWLKADRLELDRSRNRGEAHDATLVFMDVPFLYLPYLSFPLSGRKSGLLPPEIGHAETNGTDLRLPYYWNIAPNRDATLTPRWISHRGVMLESEFRYLNPESHGQLNLNYLDSDRLNDDTARWFGRFRHTASIGSGWYARTDIGKVSDHDYFDDLGNSQENRSQSHIEQRADLGFVGTNLTLLTQVQRYQTLGGNAPYDRLPHLHVSTSGDALRNRPRWQLDTQWTRFTHPTKSVTGSRMEITPALGWPLNYAAGFLRPGLKWRYTRYALEGENSDTSPERTVPITTLDSGLFFERTTEWDGRHLTQTLEPRIYYLDVPYREQDKLPNFDAGRLDFGYSQLFGDNRFSGGDRIGDTRQITLALSSRLLNGENGNQIAHATLGQIHYLTDRRVGLTRDTPDETDTTSDYVAMLNLRPAPTFNLDFDLQWDPRAERSELLGGTVRYRANEDRILNVGYRYRRESELHQGDISIFWPLARHWQFLGRWQYDLDNTKSIDAITGFEYSSCCWSFRLVGRAQRDSIAAELEQSIYFTLELKGLSRIGRDLKEVIETGIIRQPGI